MEKVILTNNLTGEVEVVEQPTMKDTSVPLETLQEPTIEEQVIEIKSTLSTVVDTLAEIVGVE